MRHELTAADIQKMKEEIEYRKVTLRKELLVHVKVARAHGDLSENFEYKAAKKEKNRNESRIRYLERMIKTSSVIEDNTKEDEVGVNNTVTVVFVEDGSEEQYRIVTTMRQDSLKGLISVESPLGKTLLGHKIGDQVTVQVNPNVCYQVRIKEILKTEDESNDELRNF